MEGNYTSPQSSPQDRWGFVKKKCHEIDLDSEIQGQILFRLHHILLVTREPSLSKELFYLQYEYVYEENLQYKLRIIDEAEKSYALAREINRNLMRVNGGRFRLNRNSRLTRFPAVRPTIW